MHVMQCCNGVHVSLNTFARRRKLLAAEIDELDGVKDVTQLCLFYIDLQGEVQRLQVMSLQALQCTRFDSMCHNVTLSHYDNVTLLCAGNCRQDEGHICHADTDHHSYRQFTPPGKLSDSDCRAAAPHSEDPMQASKRLSL